MSNLLRRLAALALLSVFLALPCAALADSGTALAPAALVDAGAPAPDSDGITTSPGTKATDATATAPDPTADPAGAFKAVTAEKDHAGLFAAIALAVYILAAAAMRASGHVGWLAEDRKLAIITGLMTISASVVDKFENHTSWMTVAGAAVAALAIWLHPTHPNAADGTAPPKTP